MTLPNVTTTCKWWHGSFELGVSLYGINSICCQDKQFSAVDMSLQEWAHEVENQGMSWVTLVACIMIDQIYICI